MEKEQIICNILSKTYDLLEINKQKLLSEIKKEIDNIKIKIINEMTNTINKNPIDSFIYIIDNNQLSDLPYDYHILSKYCTNIKDIIHNDLLKRLSENDDQKNDDQKKIFIKLTKKIEKLKNDAKILNCQMIEVKQKYDDNQKKIKSQNFINEINRLHDIKHKYDLIK